MKAHILALSGSLATYLLTLAESISESDEKMRSNASTMRWSSDELLSSKQSFVPKR
jgi:hypothetical protein